MPHRFTLLASTKKEIFRARDSLALMFPQEMSNYGDEPKRAGLFGNKKFALRLEFAQLGQETFEATKEKAYQMAAHLLTSGCVSMVAEIKKMRDTEPRPNGERILNRAFIIG